MRTSWPHSFWSLIDIYNAASDWPDTFYSQAVFCLGLYMYYILYQHDHIQEYQRNNQETVEHLEEEKASWACYLSTGSHVI